MADYRLPFTGEQVENILTNATPQSELTQETERAQGAEQTLQGNIDTEERDRKAADNQLQQNIDAEQQARIDDVDAEETRAKAAEKQNADDIDVIEGKIPAAASPSNQLADKAFVNSSIATATATYRGAYNLVSDLHLTISATEADVATALAASIQTADNNDYCFVQVPVANDNPTEIARVDRYKYNGTAWALEYTLNNSGYTASQWAALNSGITSGLVAKLNLLPTKAELDALLNAKAPQATTYTKSEVDALIANFITASVNNLVNYYLKSDTYTKAEVQQLIDAVKQFTYQSVATLPTASADTMNKIYLVPSTNPQTKNVKDEFITIATTDQGTTTYSWEQIGTTTIDLSGYYTSQQTDAAISNALSAYSTTTEMQTYVAGIIASYYTKNEVDTLLNTKAPQATTYTKSEVDAMVGNEETRAKAAEKANADDIDVIDGKIPAAASPSNQLADKAFVNSSIATATATYRGAYNLVSDLSLTVDATEQQIAAALASEIATADNNDYCFVQVPVANDNPTEIARVDRYKYNGTAWALEYTLNNSGYTAAQWDALNSGITSGLVAKLIDLPTNAQLTGQLATKYEKPVGGIPDTDLSVALQTAIASFITASTQNLVYYYLKSETYSATEVDQLLAAIKQFTYEAVAVLPEASAQTVGKIYLVPSADPKTQNVKDEFITLTTVEEGTTTYSWECIGSTTLDLTNYYTKTQTDAAITAALNTALASYSTTAQVGTLISTAINSALQAYATKEYVGQQVQEYAGTFRGTFDTLAELEETVGNHHNDYAWVKATDSDGDNDYDRYKYNGSAWVYEYRLNNTHFTDAELAAIRSGMTTAKREKLDALPTNTELTTMLNALTRRTRLSDFSLSTLKQAVADQNLEKYGLKVGDYKTINGHDYVIAGLNPMKGTSTPYRLTANHVGLIVIPHTTQAWNASGNTYTGADSRGAGYANSDLHYYLVNTLLPLVKTDLGAANLLAHSKLLSNAVNQNGINRYGEATGCSSGWGWVADQYISALSEVQVYGSTVWSSSGYDTGEACRQLDVFRHYNHTEIFGGEYPWLRDVVSASHAANADNYGHANYSPASTARCVAALILFN